MQSSSWSARLAVVPLNIAKCKRSAAPLRLGLVNSGFSATLGDPIHRRASSDPGRVLWFYSMGGDVAPLAIVMRQTTAGLVVETPCL
nr:putative integron gene cassette protein [uncultured bacterium]